MTSMVLVPWGLTDWERQGQMAGHLPTSPIPQPLAWLGRSTQTTKR